MNNKFFVANRKKVMEGLENNSMVVLFPGEAPQKTGDENYNFTPNRNFYYLTGINRENMVLMITNINNTTKETLFIEKSDEVLAKWIGERMSIEEAKKISAIEDVQFVEDFEGKLNNLALTYDLESIYLDLERRGFNSLLTQAQSFAKVVNEKYPSLKVKNIYNVLFNIRAIKTEEEIQNIREAIEITHNGIKNAVKNMKPGMMEYEIEAYFDFTLKSAGVTDYAFNTIAASGVNGTVLHYSENNTRTKDGDLILFDLGAQWNYYNGDISRTFPLNGKFTERQKQIYNLVLKANLAVIEAIKPGVPFLRLNEITREILAEGLKNLGIIKEDSELSKYYFHGVSHYLGLDCHDVGSREINLEPGMVLTVEPGLYIPEEKIGIRIEDDVLVTKDGRENLSTAIMKTVEEIEAFMAK